MSLNVDKANESSGGYAVSDQSGNTTGFYTSGVDSPVGSACPIPTLYLRDVGGAYEIWRNTGPLGSDWIQLGTTTGDLCIGGVSANYNFTPEQCVGGGDANGD